MYNNVAARDRLPPDSRSGGRQLQHNEGEVSLKLPHEVGADGLCRCRSPPRRLLAFLALLAVAGMAPRPSRDAAARDRAGSAAHRAADPNIPRERDPGPGLAGPDRSEAGNVVVIGGGGAEAGPSGGRGGDKGRGATPTLWHVSIPKTGLKILRGVLDSPAVPLRVRDLRTSRLAVLVGRLSRGENGHCSLPNGQMVEGFLQRQTTVQEANQTDSEEPPGEVLSAMWDLGTVRTLQDAAGPARPSLGAFTVLRDPVQRMVSQIHDMRGLGLLSAGGGLDSADVRDALSPKCVHNSTFCEVLLDPFKCSARGSCGMFQNLQALYLAGWDIHMRPLPDLVRLSLDDSYLLSESRKNLESLEMFGLLEHMHTSICLMAHTFRWTETFNACCTGEVEAARHPELCLPIERTKENAEHAHAPPPGDDFLRAVAGVNRVDIELYAHAQELFWRLVRAMENATGVDFSAPANEGEVERSGRLDQSFPMTWDRLGDGWMAAGGDPHQVFERGLAMYAVGEGELQKAAKSFSSAKMAHGQTIRTTLLTDAKGLKWAKQWSHEAGLIVDRAVNLMGRTTRLDNVMKPENVDHRNNRGCLAGQTVKEGKIMAIRAAAKLHHYFVFTDSDIFHCTNQAVSDLLQIVQDQNEIGLVFASSSDWACQGESSRNAKCDEWVRINYPGIDDEVNSGVFAGNGMSPVLQAVLTKWPEQYQALKGTPCSHNDNDQKSLRVAIHKGKMGRSHNNSSAVMFLWKNQLHNSHGYEPSDAPFNCRARPHTRLGKDRDLRGICQHPTYRHCSIIHGHLRAASNVDSATLNRTMVRPGDAVPWDVVVFQHIPKTGGTAFKKRMLPLLARLTQSGTMAVNINDGVDFFRQPEATRSWDPPRFLYSAYCADACRWLQEISAQSGGKKMSKTCGYITILCDPIDRLVSELNYCEEMKWDGEQACTGMHGAHEFRDAVASARRRGGAGEALATFAERRGNVLLEHIAAPLVAADFFQDGEPLDWRKRDLGRRVNPIELRRKRQGTVNRADLALGKLILSSQYAVVGLLERLEESYVRIMKAVAPAFLGEINVTAVIEKGMKNSKDHKNFKSKTAPAPSNRTYLSREQMKRVKSAMELDIELYAYAKMLFDLAGDASQWDDKLGSLAKQERLAYGKEYKEAKKMPVGMDYEHFRKQQCSKSPAVP